MFSLPDSLVRAKATSDLRELMLKYTPLQTPWLYNIDKSDWPLRFLNEVQKMVCSTFLYAGDITNSFAGLW